MPRAAIWGSGFAAGIHAEALRSCGVDIAAVVSRSADQSRAFAQRWDIPRWGQDEGILFEEGIDCVHICTPPGLHYEMAKALLEHGKHVICEKPLCLENDQAMELAALAWETGLVCAVNFNARYHDACLRARQLCGEGALGRLLLIHGSYLQEFGALPARADWRYDPHLAGSMHAVTEIGSHWLDLAQHISAERVAAVSANFGRFYPERWVENGMMHARQAEGRRPMGVSSEDAAVISLRFAGGAMGAVTLSELSHGRYNHLSLELCGERGSLWWNSESGNLLHTAGAGSAPTAQVFAFGNGFTDTFRRLAAEVYADVAAGRPSARPSYPTFESGRDSVLLLNAVYESAANHSAWISVQGRDV